MSSPFLPAAAADEQTAVRSSALPASAESHLQGAPKSQQCSTMKVSRSREEDRKSMCTCREGSCRRFRLHSDVYGWRVNSRGRRLHTDSSHQLNSLLHCFTCCLSVLNTVRDSNHPIFIDAAGWREVCCLRPAHLVAVVIVTSVVLGSIGSAGALSALPAAGAASAANAPGAPDAVPVSSCRRRQTMKTTECEAGDEQGEEGALGGRGGGGKGRRSAKHSSSQSSGSFPHRAMLLSKSLSETKTAPVTLNPEEITCRTLDQLKRLVI